MPIRSAGERLPAAGAMAELRDHFSRAQMRRGGKVSEPGTLTVLQNDVLVQDHVTIKGVTYGGSNAHDCETGPLRLQDHYHPESQRHSLRYRNIWYRPLE